MAASSSDAPSTGGFDPLPHGALTAEVRTQLRPAAFCDVMVFSCSSQSIKDEAVIHQKRAGLIQLG